MTFYDWMGCDEELKAGSYVAVYSKNHKVVQVDEVKGDRVFYGLNGKRHWARKENVGVVIKVRIGHPVSDQRQFIGCTAPVTENWEFQNGKVVIHG